jgi:hypothetical protein
MMLDILLPGYDRRALYHAASSPPLLGEHLGTSVLCTTKCWAPLQRSRWEEIGRTGTRHVIDQMLGPCNAVAGRKSAALVHAMSFEMRDIVVRETIFAEYHVPFTRVARGDTLLL